MNDNGATHEEVADVSAQRIAHTYAEALLNAAEKQNQAQEILDELTSLDRDVLGHNPVLEDFLASPAVSREHKANAILATFDGRASDVLVRFLLVLNQHDRLELLHPILAAYRELHDERTNRVQVLVKSAVPLADDQLERLRQQLRDGLKREPVVEARVDTELLGGMVVRVGDWLYDASVRSRLEQIRTQLIERSSYEIQSGRDRFRTD